MSLVVAAMAGGGPIGPSMSVEVAAVQTAAIEPERAVDETAPVAVPPASDKAMRCYRSGNVLWVVNVVWSIAILAVILWTGFSATLRDWSQRLGRRWWLYTGLAMIPFIIVGNLVAPIWIAPLFNKFSPMRDKALEARILSLADRAGIEGSRVFEVNKSVDTKTLNAYVAGMFSTKRIVLWDTIIRRMTPSELMFVMGHEMGHFVLWHTWYLVAFSSLLIMGSFYAAYRTAGAVLARWGPRFGCTTLADIASLPLILLLISGFSLIVTPLSMAFTRHIEHEADRFGLEITQTSHSAGTAFVKLQEDALANPRPGLLHELWRESHPTLGDRIDFVNQYHPWRDGQPLVYGDLFKR
jgi:Zn-dependent protease with chaperone function